MVNNLNICLFITVSIIFFVPLEAGSTDTMSDEQMKQIIEQSGRMQKCMAGIDQSSMNDLAAMGEKMQADIKSLCKTGKRKEAENAAIKYSKDIANTRQMEELQKCSDLVNDIKQNMPSNGENVENNNTHVCDRYQ